MKKTKFIKTFTLVCFIGFQVIITSAKAVTSDTTIYFNEVNGLVVAEIESLKPTGSWVERADRPGFTGTSFFEWTGPDLFGEPGSGILNYIIKINTPGTYKFQWHNKVGHGSNPTEANDSWLRIPDADRFYGLPYNKPNNTDTILPHGVCIDNCPHGAGKDGWFKAFTSGATAWAWGAYTSDSDAHDIYAEFDTPGFYTVQISGRSKHHLLDRFVLSKNGVENPQSLSHRETKVSYVTGKAKVSFRVQDEIKNTKISGASVNLSGTIQTTDGSGSVFYSDMPTNRMLGFEITKTKYWDFSDSILVKRDTIIHISLEEIPDGLVDITFSTKDERGRPTGDAIITIGDKAKTTSVTEDVIFEGFPEKSQITYSIEKSGYLKVEEEIYLSKDTVINVVLVKEASVSVADHDADFKIILHPNPVSSSLLVNSNDIIQSICVVDICGRVVFSKKYIGQSSINIDVAGLNKGIYFLKLIHINNRNMQCAKFIKG